MNEARRLERVAVRIVREAEGDGVHVQVAGEIRLALDQLMRAKAFYAELAQDVGRGEQEVSSELTKVTDHFPTYSREEDQLRTRLLRLGTERRRLLLERHRELAERYRRLLELVHRYEMVRPPL